MTNDGVGKRPPSPAETHADRRVAARQKARGLRDVRRKKDRRNRYALQGSIIIGGLVIVGLIAVTIWAQIPTARIGPVNMLSDGILIGEGFEAETTAGLAPGATPVPSEPDADAEAIHIRVYVDYQCADCKVFSETNRKQLSTWLESGAATFEVHPISLFDRHSLGAKFSTRAANAAACVANYSPNSFFDFHSLLFANQPEEGTEGLTDDELVALTKRANVVSAQLIDKCVTESNYKSWVNAATARAMAGPIPDSNLSRVEGTPTVIVNGVQYTKPMDDAAAFADFASTSAGNAFNQKLATPTPTPTPVSPAEPTEEPREE